VVRSAGDAAAYSNPWLPLTRLRERLLAAYQDFIGTQRFLHAINLAKSLWPLFAQDDVVKLQAEARERWAEHLNGEADRASISEAPALRAEARGQNRRAAAHYQRLAKLWIARREYPEALWRSGENYFRGRNYQLAARLLERYLENESRNRPQALVMIGESRLALGEIDESLKPLLECLERHPKHPRSYRARLVASRAYLEKDLLDRAKTLLSENLHNDELTPKSVEWRDSLFELGRVHFREGVKLGSQSRRQPVGIMDSKARRAALRQLEKAEEAHHQAIEALREAVQRYPDAGQAIEARYLMAESYRRAAERPRWQRTMATIETKRMALTHQIRQELQSALAVYESLLDLLNQRQDQTGLSAFERGVMRNCYFARADVEFNLERYQQAIAAYSSATNRYHDRPESLEAFVQISRCYRELGQGVEARGTLEQAKVVLKRIPPDADFARTTRYRRDQWVQFLDWLSNTM
jgi:tetratricopeptide (TPR) repeat protein